MVSRASRALSFWEIMLHLLLDFGLGSKICRTTFPNQRRLRGSNSEDGPSTLGHSLRTSCLPRAPRHLLRSGGVPGAGPGVGMAGGAGPQPCKQRAPRLRRNVCNSTGSQRRGWIVPMHQRPQRGRELMLGLGGWGRLWQEEIKG